MIDFRGSLYYVAETTNSEELDTNTTAIIEMLRTSTRVFLPRTQFVSKYISTIGIDYGVKPVTVNGESVRVNFWDLSGHPDFFEIRNEFYKDSQGVSPRRWSNNYVFCL